MRSLLLRPNLGYRRFGFSGLGGPTPGASSLIQQAAATYNVPPALLMAVANQESGLNQNAISSAGAIGVMQLMPSTAAGLGVNPNDLTQNINGGAQLLSQLLTQYNGNVSLALAAYNAGPGAVAQYGGIPPYTETQNYVAAILAACGAGCSTPSTPVSTDTMAATPAPLDFYSSFSDSSPDYTPYVLAGVAALALVVLMQ